MVMGMSGENKPYAAFILSLLSGLLILASSSFMLTMFPLNFGGMMGGGMMPWMGGFFWTFAIISIILGILILVGAVMLYTKPEQTKTWGTVILVLAVVSLFFGGGFLIGAILGIIGGILALTS